LAPDRTIKGVSDFYAYVAVRRPPLEEAYNRRLSALLDGIKTEDMAPLMLSLQAGKKIRGCLSCLVCEALGGPLEQAIPRAVAVEMIQAATLIHDDLVDQDAVRGGRPAVWTLEGPRRAVLIGDVIFAAAIKMMSDISAEDGRAVADAIASVSRGALQEPLDPLALAENIESGDSCGRLYDGIVRLKTGTLFGIACTLGAIAAGRSGRAVETCYRYGLWIGEAYQIADDVKEVKECLSRRLMDARQMAAIAPALLRFVPDMRPFVLDVLRRDRSGHGDGDRELLKRAARLMEDAIDQRQRAAAAEIERNFPGNGYSEVARRAPRDIVAIFNESP